MPLRNARPITIKPIGLTDSQDGTNTFPGGMALLQNLVASPTTRSIMVPRPASTLITNFPGFNAPLQGEALLVVGTRYYGLIATSRFPGKSEPFLYDAANDIFLPVTGVTSTNTPTTQPTTGDWTPPQMAQIGGRIFVVDVGFDGVDNFFGWFDVTGFTDTGKTGDTHGPGNDLVDNLSTNVLQAGWAPGQLITNGLGDFAPNTRIKSIAANGLSLTVTPDALASNVGAPLNISGGNANNPLWSAGNTTPFPLPAVPIAITQFSGRGWFGYNTISSSAPPLGAVAYSDAGAPLLITNATVVQVITFQNGLPVTALAGLPLNNQLGGIIQALIVFQGAGNFQQITGDQATSNLAVNSSNEAVGTLAPNSIAPTPMGVMFMAPDGLRYIDFNGHVSPPIGANGDGIAYPYINAIYPTRIAAAYNEDVYRASVYGNQSSGGIEFDSPMWQEFWYHVKLKAWSGPHGFPPGVIRGSQRDLGFILFPVGNDPIGLWHSNTLPRLDSTYVENGLQLSCVYRTVLEPDNQEMAENTVVETSIMIRVPPETTALVSCLNEDSDVLNSVFLPTLDPSPLTLKQRPVEWGTLLVFKQASFLAAIHAEEGVAIGNVYVRYKPEGYLMPPEAVVPSVFLLSDIGDVLLDDSGNPLIPG